MLTIETGQNAEQIAYQFLINHGFKPVMRNYRCRWGEIDLIMRDKSHLVFIEVRQRAGMAFGGGLGSITYAKKQKIIKTTAHYMLQFKINEKMPIRFDVISIHGKTGEITWIKDAFGTDY